MNLIIKKVAACIIATFITVMLFAQPKITRVEYYIDKDPGYGKATKVSITSAVNIPDKQIKIDPTQLSVGVHLFCIRAKDSKGAWSLDNKWLFVIQQNNTSATPQIKTIEYYIDKDPGYGKATPVAINSAINIANFNLSVNVSALKQGNHVLYIRSKDSKGAWGLDNVDSFSIPVVINPATIVINSLTNASVCVGSSFKVGIQANGIYDSTNVFKVQLSSKSGDFSNAKTIGTLPGKKDGLITCLIPASTASGNTYKLRVITTSPPSTGKISDIIITINSVPSKPTITSVPQNTVDLCPGTSVTLTSSSGSNNLWNTGATTKAITVDSAAAYYVTVSNANGCGNTSDSMKVSYSICGKPASPLTKGITTTSAKFTWKRVACAAKYRVAYRLADSGVYSYVDAADTFYIVSGLTPDTKYQWKVQTICSNNPPISGDYTQVVNFRTNASIFTIADASSKTIEAFNASIVPNPSIDEASVLVTRKPEEKVTILLSDMAGKVLWKTENNGHNNIQLPVHKVAAGTYLITIINGAKKKTLKFIKE